MASWEVGVVEHTVVTVATGIMRVGLRRSGFERDCCYALGCKWEG